MTEPRNDAPLDDELEPEGDELEPEEDELGPEDTTPEPDAARPEAARPEVAPKLRAAAKAPPSAKGRAAFAIDPALRIRDRASAVFVAATTFVFLGIFLYAMFFGRGGALTPVRTPAPIVSPSPGASPTLAPSGSPIASPTVPASPASTPEASPAAS